MTTLSLKLAESVIAAITSAIQLCMCAVVVYLFALFAVSFTQHNFKANRIECGHYITDSTHAWLEIVNSHDNSRVVTLTYDCTNDSIIDVKWGA